MCAPPPRVFGAPQPLFRGAQPLFRDFAALVVGYGGMLADSVRLTHVVCEYLEGIGVGLGHDARNEH